MEEFLVFTRVLLSLVCICRFYIFIEEVLVLKIQNLRRSLPAPGVLRESWRQNLDACALFSLPPLVSLCRGALFPPELVSPSLGGGVPIPDHNDLGTPFECGLGPGDV